MKNKERTFGIISLGCPKNTVDSEGLLGTMALAGWVFVEDPMYADVCIVNTCGFLESARNEAAAVLHELTYVRALSDYPVLVATGCLVERVGGAPELARYLDLADVRVGFADYPRLADICAGLADSRAAAGYAGEKALPKTYMQWLDRPRMRIGSMASAYVKIGEGCSNCCAYCSIPLIRGRRASRPMTAVLKEVRDLAASGVREVNLIAQDVTAYGTDLNAEGRPQFAELLCRLLKQPEPPWFRVLYAHPKHLSEEMLEMMASSDRVCPYLDVPLQHVNTGVLRRMGRGYGRTQVDRMVRRLAAKWPDAALRTTFIVGHPGEDEAAFDELLEFVKEGHFEHVGVFVWSPEPGTPSAAMKPRVPQKVAKKRRAALMRAQREVSAVKLKARRGRHTEFLVEEMLPDGSGWLGRTRWQAPEVDGLTVLKTPAANPPIQEGDILPVVITSSSQYDCRAKLQK